MTQRCNLPNNHLHTHIDSTNTDRHTNTQIHRHHTWAYTQTHPHTHRLQQTYKSVVLGRGPDTHEVLASIIIIIFITIKK